MRLGAGWFALLLAMAAQASPDLRLEGGPFLPYRINHAMATSQTGMLGTLALLGRRWDGGQVHLFLTRVAARSQVVELAFYLDEDIRGLTLQAEGPGAAGSVAIDLAADEGSPPAAEASEIALRNRMRSLEPPVHITGDGEPPERFYLGGSDLLLAGFQASFALFAIAPSRAPLWPLGGFVLAALIAAVIAPQRPTAARIVLVGAVIGATVAVVFLSVPKPTLFRVAFPEAGGRLSGVLERKLEELPGYKRVTYAAGQGEGSAARSPRSVELVGLWAPAGSGVPVAEIVPPGALVHFSSPPPALWLDGELILRSKAFVTGWVVHANP